MPIAKFKFVQQALIRFEKIYGSEGVKVFSVANGYISRELTDGMVAGVLQRAVIDKKILWIVPIILSKKACGDGELGVILIDNQILLILGTTDRSENFQKVEMLVNEQARVA